MRFTYILQSHPDFDQLLFRWYVVQRCHYDLLSTRCTEEARVKICSFCVQSTAPPSQKKKNPPSIFFLRVLFFFFVSKNYTLFHNYYMLSNDVSMSAGGEEALSSLSARSQSPPNLALANGPELHLFIASFLENNSDFTLVTPAREDSSNA